MTESPQRAPAPAPKCVDAHRLDAAGCVRDDTPCVQCEYNLRTLAASALCPECGRPVAESLRRPLLKYSGGEWLDEHYVRGIGLLVTGLALALLGIGFVGLSMLSAQLITSDTMAGAAIVGVLFAVMGFIPIIAGTVVCTAPEPGIPPRRGERTAARVARWGMVAVVLLVGLGSMAGSPWFAAGAAWLGAVMALAIIPGAILRHIAQVLRRVPAPTLAARIESRGRVLGVIGLIGVLLSLGILTPEPAGILILVALGAVAYLVLLAIIWRALREAEAAVASVVAGLISAQSTTESGANTAPPPNDTEDRVPPIPPA